MEFKNDLGLVGKIAAHSVMSGKYKDKDGNIKEILPVGPGNSLDFDQFREDIGAFGGGAGGTDTDEEHPSSGVDYYAGSLVDGEITERKLEWSGTDDPTKNLTVTFIDDPGSKPFGQYTGLTFLAHIQKTVVTAGVKGAVSKIELNYDTKNTPKSGYYTTTSPYPFYIKSSDLVAGKKLTITINGIGENLGGKSIKEPSIDLTYNADRTMTIVHTQGHENDGAEKPTGSTYDLVIDTIATFSTQAAVAQLPSSINLFTGSTTDDAALAGASDYYENVMDGIKLTFEPEYTYTAHGATSTKNGTFTLEELGLVQPVFIKKEELIEGLSLNVFDESKFKTYSKFLGGMGYYMVSGLNTNKISIGKSSINIDITLNVGESDSGTDLKYPRQMSLKLTNISPYKK